MGAAASIIGRCPACCEPPALPPLQARSVQRVVSRRGFAPFDQVQLSPWGPTLVSAVETFYRRRTDTYESSHDYAGFVFATYTGGSWAGCCVKNSFTYSSSVGATVVAEFAAEDGGAYTVTRTPDFSEPAGTTDSTERVEGQGGCSEIPPEEWSSEDVPADFGGGGLSYYFFQNEDATSATTRAGVLTDPNYGGRSGAASCEGGSKVVPGTLVLSGQSTLSLPFTRLDAAAEAEAGLDDLEEVEWAAAGTVQAWRLVSEGALSQSGLSFTRNGEAVSMSVSVGRAQWRAEIREEWWIGYVHRLFFRYDFYAPGGATPEEGEEEWVDIEPDGEATHADPVDVPDPSALGTLRLVLLRVERRKNP